jgi:hypothetical protein
MEFSSSPRCFLYPRSKYSAHHFVLTSKPLPLTGGKYSYSYYPENEVLWISLWSLFILITRCAENSSYFVLLTCLHAASFQMPGNRRHFVHIWQRRCRPRKAQEYSFHTDMSSYSSRNMLKKHLLGTRYCASYNRPLNAALYVCIHTHTTEIGPAPCMCVIWLPCHVMPFSHYYSHVFTQLVRVPVSSKLCSLIHKDVTSFTVYDLRLSQRWLGGFLSCGI